ncbi:MAG: hypothetical protein SYC29_01940 [Planctomycetota bacterium]|nr:hypothetical protein [Planctomycetota bacterium]
MSAHVSETQTMIAPNPTRTTLDAALAVSTDRLLRRLGHSADRALSPRLSRQIDGAVDRVLDYARPWTTRRAHAIEVERGLVRIDRTLALRSFRLARSLRPCHTLYVYVVTLGNAVDQLIARAMRRRPAFGVVLDAAASVAAESLVEQLHEEIADDLPPDQTYSLPFSPGYCDWPLHEQQKLFALLPGEVDSAVALSPDHLMRPRKSIAGVIGIGPAELLDEIPSPCLACGREDCPYRRE